MMDYIASHGLDIFTTVLGLIYILLEYRASIWLWAVGIIMPALDVWLYWSHGLYGDAGMAVYYTVAAVYGYAVWKFGKKHNQTEKEELPITYMKKSLYLPTAIFFLAAWGITYYILITFTNSTVPLQDSFTNALSFVGLWALARKYPLNAVLHISKKYCTFARRHHFSNFETRIRNLALHQHKLMEVIP